ncbi:ribonuclease H-like domain-containing protein [Tanacetum coccineum]
MIMQNNITNHIYLAGNLVLNGNSPQVKQTKDSNGETIRSALLYPAEEHLAFSDGKQTQGLPLLTSLLMTTRGDFYHHDDAKENMLAIKGYVAVTTSPSYSTITLEIREASSSHGSVVDDVIRSFLAKSEPKQQLAYEDLKQIKKLDLEELDLKWQMAMLSIRVQKFKKKAGRKIKFNGQEAARFDKKLVQCYQCSQKGHFARECRAKASQDSQKVTQHTRLQNAGKRQIFSTFDFSDTFKSIGKIKRNAQC